MSNVLTYNDVVNSYEFKLTEKILKREHPWIKRIDITPEDLNYYKIIFINIYFDPYELAKDKDWKIAWYKVRNLREGKSFSESYLTIFYDVSYEEQKELMNDIEDTLRAVKKSQAVPNDLKLPTERNFSIGSWVSIPNPQIPEDAEEYEQKYVRT